MRIIQLLLIIFFWVGCSKFEQVNAPEPVPEPKVLPVTFSSDQPGTQIIVYPLAGMNVDMENPIAGPLTAPAEVTLPEGKYAARGTKVGFQDQFISFQVVTDIPASVEFRLLPIAAQDPAPELSLFINFTNILPDSFKAEQWQNSWHRVTIPEVSQTMQIMVLANTLYRLTSYQHGQAISQTVLIGQENAAVDVFLLGQSVKLIFGSDKPGTVLMRQVDSESGDTFEIGTNSVNKYVERNQLYWVSFTAEDQEYFAASQLILASSDQVIQPDWKKFQVPPDTIEVTVTVHDTVIQTIHDSTFITVLDTILVSDTLVVIERDTFIVVTHDTSFIAVHDTTVVIKNFYRERLIDFSIHGDVAIVPGTSRESVTRVFRTLFDGRVYIWGREVRGPDSQTDERYRIEVRRVDTAELLATAESPDTGSGETTRQMAVTQFLPVNTPVELKWIAIGDPSGTNSVHFPEVIAQNFDPEL